jgi:hypothetical protein
VEKTDVIITGLPRSGSTVVAALVDSLPDAVCLNMPAWHTAQARQIANPIPYAKWLAGDFLWTRQQLLQQVPIKDFRAADGSPLLDSIRDPRQPHLSSGKETSVPFTRPGLSKDFILGMKHHVLYSAVLPQLVKFDHFKIIAVIRHPLDVIASWQRLDGRAIFEGKMPAAARFWPEAARISASKGDPLERMIQLYDAHLERYHSLGDQIHILKYEDVVDDPLIVSTLLSRDTLPTAANLIEFRPRVRINSVADDLRARFEKSSVFTKYYYPKL